MSYLHLPLLLHKHRWMTHFDRPFVWLLAMLLGVQPLACRKKRVSVTCIITCTAHNTCTIDTLYLHKKTAQHSVCSLLKSRACHLHVVVSTAGFPLGGGGERGHLPPLNMFCPPPLKSNRPSSYTTTCVFMLPPKISYICGSPPLVTFSEINPEWANFIHMMQPIYRKRFIVMLYASYACSDIFRKITAFICTHIHLYKVHGPRTLI